MKSYTDVAQSRKLAEILPLESADMWYSVVDNEPFICLERHCEHEQIPCWSLAALLSVLPILDNKHAVFGTSIKGSKWHVIYHNIDTLFLEDSGLHSNLVDACYEMILKLKELNLL